MGIGFSSRLAKSIVCPHCNTKIDTVRVKILQPKLLIVEGKDEEEFFTAFLTKTNVKDVQVVGAGGKTGIGNVLQGLIKESEFFKVISLGVIRDADFNPQDAFQSVKNALIVAGLPSPKRVLSFVKGPPMVGVMILPSMRQHGALEDLCLQAVANDPAMTCVAQYFDCIFEQGSNKPKAKKLSKAKVRVFLSSREDPTLPLGIAAQKGYWPLESNVFKNVRRFLQAL